jgi:peptide-O-fucosyltransferase
MTTTRPFRRLSAAALLAAAMLACTGCASPDNSASVIDAGLAEPLAVDSIHVVHADASDAPGFVAYCPCSGRLGAQIDSLLSAIAFASAVNRTLLLPPFVYAGPRGRTRALPFERILSVDALAAHHRVALLDDFVRSQAGLADDQALYPADKRVWICPGRGDRECPPLEGAPFAEFWALMNVTFARSVPTPLSVDIAFDSRAAAAWRAVFPPASHPVLAFRVAPGRYPAPTVYHGAHSCLSWASSVRSAADRFMNASLPRPYVAVHLRESEEWQRACKSAVGRPEYMQSIQCSHAGPISSDMCTPTMDRIVEAIRRAVRTAHAQSVLIGSDTVGALKAVQQVFAGSPLISHGVRVPIVAYEGPRGVSEMENAAVDLALFEDAELFIGNCLSSFTAAAARSRTQRGRPTLFWGMEQDV